MKVTKLLDKSFDEEIKKSELPILVYFWAGWCSDCKAFSSIFNQLTKEYSDKIRFAKLDTESNLQTPEKYFVMSIPTLILFENGKEKLRLIEKYNINEIKTSIENELNKKGVII